MTSKAPAAEMLDVLIDGLAILTGDPKRPFVAKGRIGIRENRIAVVAAIDDRAPAPPARRVMDGSRLLATPGFVNVHTHTILTMVRGVAEDMGFAPAYTPGVPHGHEVTPDEAVALAQLGALEALKFGSTLINDTYVHADLTLPAMGDIGLRVAACGRIHDVDFSRVADGVWIHETSIGRRTLEEALALHQRFNGSMDGRLFVQLAAHAPDTCSTAFLREIRAARDATGMPVTTHLSQSRTEVARIRERDSKTPTELLDEVGLLDASLIAAHCIWMTESDIGRAGRAGINVAHVPKGNATGATMAPTPKLRDAGANLALATDNMHADMVEAMRWGLNVARLQNGLVDDAWQPKDVFAMANRNGAKAMGLAGQIGELVVGQKADIVLFDVHQPHWTPRIDTLGNLVHVGQGRDVLHVFVDGRLVIENGRSTLVDENAVIEKAQRAAEALWARARASVRQ